MKRFTSLFLLLPFVAGLSACQAAKPLSSLEAIQKQLVEMDGYSCTATLTRTSNKGENVYETAQSYSSTGEYRLELTAPENVAGNCTIYDGNRICQFNPRLDSASKIIKDADESQHRNELFLGQFIKNYMQSKGVGVEAVTLNDSQCVVLEALIPGIDDSLSSEKLWVDSTTLLPVRLCIYDKNGDERYRIDYHDFVFNPTFDETTFRIPE